MLGLYFMLFAVNMRQNQSKQAREHLYCLLYSADLLVRRNGYVAGTKSLFVATAEKGNEYRMELE